MNNYWHIQLHPDNTIDFPLEKVRKLLEEKSLIGLGNWEGGESQINQFKDDMKIGDIVAVRSGKKPIALVEVVGEHEYTENVNKDLDWFENRRKVRVLDYCDGNCGFEIPMAQGTLTRCANLNNETSKVIIDWHQEAKKKIDMTETVDLIKTKHQVIFQGPPGTGKTRECKKIANYFINGDYESDDFEKVIDSDQAELIQFHSSYSYEDFVRGIVAKPNGNGISYETEDKTLLNIANKAANDHENPYILIIDEINRANLSAVLGELIYALEYRGECVKSMYPEHKDNDNYEISLPENLYILGTMNTADYSTGNIDYAIRRRFGFISKTPDKSVLSGEAFELFESVEGLFRNHLSPEFSKDDVMIGHSYFIAEDENGNEDSDKLKTKLEYEIKPILYEYAKDGILIDTASPNDDSTIGNVKKAIYNLSV